MADTDHDRTPEPVCPKCGAEIYSGDLLLGGQGDGASAEVECDECGASFKVTMHVEYSYSTELKEKEKS